MSSESIQILFVGDFIPKGHFGNIFSDGLLEVLENKDFSIVNLECPLTTADKGIQKIGRHIKASPKMIGQILNGKFDAVALSNNHIRDFADKGVIDTLETCRKHGVLTVGAGKDIEHASRPLIIEIKRKKLAIFNYSEKEFNCASRTQAGANSFDLINSFNQLRAAKTNVDYRVVIYHGGLEYHYLPSTEMIRRLKFLVDAGADTIVCHHTHRYSGVIYYKDKPIIFGLGNFLVPALKKVKRDWLVGIISKIVFSASGIEHKLIPIKMAEDFGSITILREDQKDSVLEHIKQISMNIQNDIFLSKYWNDIYDKNTTEILNKLNSNSYFTFRIRKFLSFFLSPVISNYKRFTLLNMIKCNSIREELISILEKY